VCVREPELERLRIKAADLVAILSAKNLRAVPAQSLQGAKLEADEQAYWFSSPGRSTGLQQLKDLVLRPAGALNGIALQAFCRFHAVAVQNSQSESRDHRFFNMRRLRESVFRDLRWLLNSASLDSTEQLSRYPEVERSVVNYGMPALAGRPMSSIDARATAERISRAISCFEPRLSKVHVSTAMRTTDNQVFALEFQIEAELWGQPLPQQLLMRTRIDLDTGQVAVTEVGA
jgi:type VI secretion system protein ImpF